MKRSRLILLSFILIMPLFLSAISTSIFYDKKLFGGENHLRIYLCDKSGNGDLSSIDLSKQDYVFFAYEPENDWELKEKDLKGKLNEIELIQSGHRISQDYLNPIIIDEKLQKVVAAYNKSEFEFHLPINFKLGDIFSAKISLSEELWPDYEVYKNHLYNSMAHFKEEEYLASFEQLEKFYLNPIPFLEHFSFYQDVVLQLQSSVKAWIASEKMDYELLNFDLTQDLQQEKLNELIELKNEIIDTEQSFSSYFNTLSENDEIEIIQDFSDLKQTVINSLDKHNSTLEREKLNFLASSNYYEYKFKFYIDLICDLLIWKDTIEIFEDPDSLTITKLSLFPDQKAELELLGWNEEFSLLIKLLNENVSKENYYFGPEIIENLNSQIDLEPKPYAGIFSAFDHLAGKEYDQFAARLNEAFIKCSEQKMLLDLENWYLSYLCTVRSVEPAILDLYQTAKGLEDTGQFEEAKLQYEIAVKTYHDFAPPWFSLGRLYYKDGEAYKAEIYFEKAIELMPEYLAPRIFKINFLINRNEYQQSLTEINSVLREMPYWFFYYLKAKSLYELKKYDDALQVMVEYCLKLNKYDIEAYFLLGDIYLALGHRNKAIESYMEAGKLDPENKKYVEKMNNIPK